MNDDDNDEPKVHPPRPDPGGAARATTNPAIAAPPRATFSEGGVVAEEGLAAVLGLVYVDLDDHRRMLHGLMNDPAVKGVELSVQAPLYKGNAAIVQALKDAGGLADKIDVYFRHGLCDEKERVRFARLFAQSYARKNPRVERQDLFLASGDVFAFRFELVPPMQLAVPREAFDAIAAGPHDGALLARLRSGESPERAHLKVCIRLFLDHALNPRRHAVPAVIAAAKELEERTPYVLEVSASPSIPGYARWVLDPHVRAAGGRVVWLPT